MPDIIIIISIILSFCYFVITSLILYPTFNFRQLLSLRHTFGERKDRNPRTDDEIYEEEVDEETKLRHKIDEVR